MKNQCLSAFLLCLFIFLGRPIFAQGTFPTNGVNEPETSRQLFFNATIHLNNGRVIENGYILTENEKIKSIGYSPPNSKGIERIDLHGAHVYPGFIELISDYGLQAPPKKERNTKPQFWSNKRGPFSWNEAIKPETKAVQNLKADPEQAKKLRAMGFTAALSHHRDGIMRGLGVLLSLNQERENQIVLHPGPSSHYSFSKGSSRQDFPGSLMGIIALIKQSHFDANWYAGNTKEESNLSLEAIIAQKHLPKIIELNDKLDFFRVEKIAQAINHPFILKGSGNEYQRAEAVAKIGWPIITPLNFPKAYQIQDPLEAMDIPLQNLMHWEMAPHNFRIMREQGVKMVITADGQKDAKNFFKSIRKIQEAGADSLDIIRSLSFYPAQYINMEQELGSISNGARANFLIFSHSIFNPKAQLLRNVCDGKSLVLNRNPRQIKSGAYNVKILGDGFVQKNFQVQVSNNGNKLILKNGLDSAAKTLKHNWQEKLIQFQIPQTQNPKGQLPYRFSGSIHNNIWRGKVQDPQGNWQNWEANWFEFSPPPKKQKKKKAIENADIDPILFPFLPFGWQTAPQQETILFKNLTVWTNEKEGIVQNTDVLISGGIIRAIGKDLSKPGATIINGNGMHLTSGIIDEHSHIAISRGVNEGTQASSAEVCICDVVNSEDVNIYRQLGGGVTAAQLLHGSANPIGGRSAIIKLRWGSSPEEMQIKGADPFIKFALGENVKQSNWGDRNVSRYPQTRMGVEQVFYDHFNRALEYKKRKATGNYRIDIELETLLEIIEKKRFITCHSYQQGEINMLMKVADSFGFTINTFTHILEGYKVADKMKAHGAGASTFSDWWAYKYEVIDAIPYNAAILNAMGVITALNSDDAEMARRLNQEAAKAVKYGGVSEEDAWKMVTLNPAKLLHLDKRMGSIKVGKDADLVLWSDHPLSITAKAEKTFVDGICLFDRKEDLKKQEWIKAQKMRISLKMMGDKSAGKEKFKAKAEHHYHCDDIEDEGH